MAKNLDSLSPNKPEVSTPLSVKPTPEVSTSTAPEATAPAPAAPTTESKSEAPISTPIAPAEEAQSASASSEAAGANPDSFESLFPEPSVTIASPPSWIWWVLLVVASVGLGVIGYHLVNNKVDSFIALTPTPTTAQKKNTSSAAPTISPTTSPTPTSSPSPSASASPSTSPTTEPSATPTSTSTTTDKSSITLRVLNGTTVNGAATTVKGILEKAGFSVRTTGNAHSQTYQSTVIYYQTGKATEAKEVQDALKQYSPTIQESSTLASPDMVLVVYGG